MIEKKILIRKNITMPKAVLAAMWHLKQSGKEDLMSHKYVRIFCEDKHKNTHRSCIFRLCKSELLKKDYNNTLLLTEKGEKYALSAFIEAESALHNKHALKWDGGWRMVFFDIPEEKRRYRDYLRKVLKLVGFHEFQRSIWVYPYPVPQFLKDLIYEENIKPYVRFITTNSIDNDKDLRIIFGLMREL
jgi:DNA-binding transcriptional regulator PaaX